MLEVSCKLIRKSTVMVIDPEQVISEEIIADIDIHPSVIVNIGDAGSMPISFGLYTGNP
jgi:hypothetical protein